MAAKANPLTVLVGDQDGEAIYLLKDRNRDGDAADVGEVGVFFDGNNASGLVDPLVSILDTFQARDGSVYAGDNATDSVYRLHDRNGDGDATDAGEAWTWFSAAGNPDGNSLATPNGVAADRNGNVYVVTPGVLSGETRDLVYKTTDRNGDGDANDAGEARVWLDLQTVNPLSSAFEISFAGNVAYLTDTNGRDPDTIYRIVDKNGSGDIQSNEVSVFIADGNAFGVNPDFAHDAADGSVYAFEFTGGGSNRFWRLTDRDGSGAIDAVDEAKEIWSAALLPEGYAASAGPGMDVQSDGSILLALNGGDPTQDSVVHLVDGNADGDFQDAGETRIVLSRADGADFLSRPRPVEEYHAPSGSQEPPLRGTEFADRFTGRNGAETWSGGGGDDQARAGRGDDRLFGGSGNDALQGEAGEDRLEGDDGDDILDGGAGDDSILGGAGQDRLTGGAGRDRLDGGIGNDSLQAGAGDDIARGGEGDDVVAGDAGHDWLYGGDGSDQIGGGQGADNIKGEAGDDRLFGQGDSDVLYGGEDDDLLVAGAGLDRLYGQAGDDLLVLDVLDAGNGLDLFHGGSGEDTIELHLSRKVVQSAAFKEEFARFEAVLAKEADYSFQFKTLGLTVQNVENAELFVG